MSYNRIMEILKYVTKDEKIPFDEWMDSLKDRRAKARIKIRLDRLIIGLFGDWKSVGDGVFELRISEGQGYRVYYAKEGETIVLLLCGGNKSTQSADIKKAKQYLQDYRN